MRDLARATGLLGVQRGVTLLMGLLRVKVAAVVLGTGGMGILAQAMTLHAALAEAVGLGVGGGVTKYVAEHAGRGDEAALRRVLETVTTVFVAVSVVVLGLCAVFAPFLADLVLGDRTRGFLVLLVAAALPLTAQLEIVQRTLQGLLLVRQLVLLGILGAVAGTALAIPLMIRGGVTGAVLALAVGALVPLVIGQVYLHRVLKARYGFSPRVGRWDGATLRGLLRFGGARSASVLALLGTLLVVRTVLIERFGDAANGLYQVAWTVSNQYLGIVGVAIWSYAMPKIATVLHDRAAVEGIQNDALRLSLLLFLPASVLLLVTRPFWIPLLYSGAFLAAAPLVAWQLAGDFLRSIRWSANLTTMPREQLRFIVLEGLALAAIQLAAFFVLLPRVGIVAAPMAWAVAHAALLPVTLLWHWRVDRFLFSPATLKLTALSGVVLAVTLAATAGDVAPPLLRWGAPLAALAAWGLLAVRRSELALALAALRRRPAPTLDQDVIPGGTDGPA